MKKINKLLFVIPLALLMFGCKKMTEKTQFKAKSDDKTNVTTISTTEKTTKRTLRTTTAMTTTEEDIFDVLVVKDIEEAATVKGDGIFNINSNTTIRITLNYGYDYLGLYDGKNKLTDELTYEIKDITESVVLTAKFSPKKYNVSVEKDIEEAATITGDGEISYKSSTTIDAELAEEYLFVGLYDGAKELTKELPYTIDSVTKALNLTAKFKQKTYDVVVNQSLEDAAVITGVGAFIKGSNTTINIEARQGYNYLGLCDANGNKLTDDTTYDVKDITEGVTLNALFSANKYSFKTSNDNELLGEINLVNDTFDCGTKIELEAKAIEGYELEGWYLNGQFYSDSDKIIFKVPGFDSELVAKFKIQEFSITITDNIEGLGLYFIDSGEYDSDYNYIFDYGTYVYFDIDDVKGYDFDYLLINGEEYNYDSDEVCMDKNYVIEVFYKLADIHFFMMYDNNKLSVNSGISIDVLPDNFDYGVIDNSYSDYDGYSYVDGYYKYKTTINITLNVKTNYYLDKLIDLNDDSSIGSIENNVITLTIDDYYDNILISLLGKICHITVEAHDPVTGTATGTGYYHYGDGARITAVANKGYKFIKWIDEKGNDYGVIYGYEHDYAPSDTVVPLYGDATYIAVFVPDEFNCRYTFVTDNKDTRVLNTMILTYLTEYEISAADYAGYTFAGWLESSDISTLFSTDNVLKYTMINEDSIIYAYYTPNTYNVTLDFNGGTGSVTSTTAIYDNELTTEIPTKEKYTFGGYYSYYNEKTYTIDEQDQGKQLYYYIRYKETNYNWLITNGYMFINDIAVTNVSQTLQAGDVIKIVSHVSNNKVVAANGKGIYNIPSDSKLVAHWMVNVKYLNYDGTICYDELIEIGAEAADYHCSTERTGYTYKYWSYNNEKFNFDTSVTENITLVAYYQANQYDLKISKSTGIDSYTINGTTYSSTQTLKIDYGTTLNISCTLKDGYTFSFWKNTTLDEKYYDKDLVYIMIDQDITINIKAMAYCLDISVNDSAYGTTDPTPTSYYFEYVSYGDSLKVKATANTGYAFEAWYNAETNELLTNDAEYEFIPSEFNYDYTSGVNFKFYIKAVFGKIKTDKYERLGNKIWFGYYPQTCLNPNLQDGNNATLIEELKEMAGALPTLDTPANYEATKDSTKWSNYSSYYIYPAGSWLKAETVIHPDYSTSIKYTYLNAPHMWYIDIDYDKDGRYDYRGVLIYSYRTDEIGENQSATSSSKTHQDDNYFGSSSYYRTYWFKYEMIEWDIIESGDNTYKLVANLALDSQNFSLGSNDYASSYVRDFLINDFYNTAFSTTEKAIMNTMAIGSNNDYVTLLTSEEVENYYQNTTDRFLKSTDYAQSQNCYVNTSTYSTTTLYNCYWMTRSAETTKCVFGGNCRMT